MKLISKLGISFSEAGLHPRRGPAIFFRGAHRRRHVPLAEELHPSRGRPFGERDTLLDELRAHRVSRSEILRCGIRQWSGSIDKKRDVSVRRQKPK